MLEHEGKRTGQNNKSHKAHGNKKLHATYYKYTETYSHPNCCSCRGLGILLILKNSGRPLEHVHESLGDKQ